MIKKSGELLAELKPNLKGGKDTIKVQNILEPDEFFGAGRLFAVNTIPPGGSIGPHTHEGDYEVYYILSGKALVTDNGREYELGPGGMNRCAAGDMHSIENIGGTDLEFIALILYPRQ